MTPLFLILAQYGYDNAYYSNGYNSRKQMPTKMMARIIGQTT